MYKIDIVGYIENYWGVDYNLISSELQKANNEDVYIKMHSGGGSVIEGFAIRNTLKAYSGDTTIYVEGMAASIASVILTGANKVIMPKGAWIMIHDVTFWAQEPMTAEQMEEESKTLEFFQTEIVEAYLDAIENRGKLIDGSREKTEKEIRYMMKAETWFNAQQALDFGLIDEIAESSVQPKAVFAKNFLNKVNYKNMPTSMEDSTLKGYKAFYNNLKSFFNSSDKTEETKDIVQPEKREKIMVTNEEMINHLKNSGYSVEKLDNEKVQEKTEAKNQEVIQDFEKRVTDLETKCEGLLNEFVKKLEDFQHIQAKEGGEVPRLKNSETEKFSNLSFIEKIYTKQNK